jgi:signal transduction histidine kinase
MVDKSRSRKAGGAGLGLTLCDEIARVHHARLSLQSVMGEGTIARITFLGDMQ